MKSAQNVFNNLPATTDLYRNALRQLGVASAQGSGNPFLKMDKAGDWTYGAEGVEVDEQDEWVVNPMSFRVGVVGWSNGQKVGEEMYIIGQGQVDKSTLPEIVSRKQGDGWKDQLSFDLFSMGDNVLCTFASSSKGGKDAIGALALEISKRAELNEFPVIRCTTTHYIHKQYGKTFTPSFEVVRWDKMPEPKSDEQKRRNLV